MHGSRYVRSIVKIFSEHAVNEDVSSLLTKVKTLANAIISMTFEIFNFIDVTFLCTELFIASSFTLTVCLSLIIQMLLIKISGE